MDSDRQALEVPQQSEEVLPSNARNEGGAKEELNLQKAESPYKASESVQFNGNPYEVNPPLPDGNGNRLSVRSNGPNAMCQLNPQKNQDGNNPGSITIQEAKNITIVFNAVASSQDNKGGIAKVIDIIQGSDCCKDLCKNCQDCDIGGGLQACCDFMGNTIGEICGLCFCFKCFK